MSCALVTPASEEPPRPVSISDSTGTSGGADTTSASVVAVVPVHSPGPPQAAGAVPDTSAVPDSQEDRRAEEGRQQDLIGVGVELAADCVLLGVSLRSSVQEIARAFRQGSLEAHSDKVVNKTDAALAEARANMHELNKSKGRLIGIALRNQMSQEQRAAQAARTKRPGDLML